MKLGLQIPDFTWSSGPAQLGSTLAEIASTADSCGFEFITVMDHFWQIGMIGPPEHEMLECYSTLAFLAAHSRSAKLLGVVTGNPYRHPGILAKTVTTLDVLSGGRAWLGIGAGWNDEYRDYDSILKTCIFHLDVGDDGSKTGELVETLSEYAALGIQAVIGSVPHVERITPLEAIGRDVIPAISEL